MRKTQTSQRFRKESASSAPVVFITGASRGIGLAIAERLWQEGWRVVACARKASSLAETPADLKLACDVADPKQVKAAIAETVKKLGRLDAVVNNAGIAGSNPLEPGSSDELWHEILGTNLNGTYYVCKQAMPHLPNDGSGRIVNIASVLALRGVPDQTAYCAAKHGVLGFTRALSHHLAPRNITVNAICPGWVRTSMAAGRMKELKASEKQLVSRVPLKRFIETDEIAGMVSYLLAPEASGITGQAMTIDGGTLA